jgi:heme exporter protein C
MRFLVWKWLLFVALTAITVGLYLWVPMAGRDVYDSNLKTMVQVPWPLFRVMVFHVPVAWVAVLAFLVATLHSIRSLRKADPVADLKAAVAAELGLTFGILALITGSIWAKFEWGAFWNWDPRETSVLILLLIYGAYFALRSAVDAAETRARLSAVYAILAFLTVPFLVFIVPRMMDTLHPAPIMDNRGKMAMNPRLLVVFLGALAAFSALFFWIMDLKVTVSRLRERC